MSLGRKKRICINPEAHNVDGLKTWNMELESHGEGMAGEEKCCECMEY